MGKLTLHHRRAIDRGISHRTADSWHGRLFYPRSGAAGASGVVGNRASLTTALAGADNDLLFTAKTPGIGGNSITVAITIGGTAPVVTVAGSAITVTTPATTTAREVRDAVNAHRTASALVKAQTKSGENNTGVIAALLATALAGATATV